MADPSISTPNFLTYTLQPWAQKLAPSIVAAYELKGGWEGWAQVELALAIRRDHGGAVQGSQNIITREDTIYKGSDKRTDILVTTKAGGVTKWRNGIELKCESYHNAAGFITAVKQDLTKINHGPDFGPCPFWAVAISVSKEAQANMQSQVPQMTKHVLSGDICLWTFKKDFKV